MNRRGLTLVELAELLALFASVTAEADVVALQVVDVTCRELDD